VIRHRQEELRRKYLGLEEIVDLNLGSVIRESYLFHVLDVCLEFLGLTPECL
jgi:hypothetical protein